MYNLAKALASLYLALVQLLNYIKKAQIIEAKNKALKEGDQRDLESSLSDDGSTNVDNSPRYSGMHERPVKKKP